MSHFLDDMKQRVLARVQHMQMNSIGNELQRRRCERSAAIQSSEHGTLDCHAPLATTETGEARSNPRDGSPNSGLPRFARKDESVALAEMMIKAEKDVLPFDFCEIFRNKQASAIISEIKFASPSRGNIYLGPLNHIQIAERYMTHGASALSVLTEPDYFKGDIQYIRDIRETLPECPILLKDFVLAPIQIKQAQVFGANAVLLIVAFLEPSLMSDLYDYAISLGLTPLIEVHDEDELAQALTLRPKIIGINNRNLKTMAIDLETSRRLIRQIPDDVFAVCESGIATRADIVDMRERGFDGFLIGSHMMQSNDPGEALSALLQRESHAR